MKLLSKGKKEETILTLLKNLISATQGNFHGPFLDDEGIKDIADVITTEKRLFAQGENPSLMMNDCGEPNSSGGKGSRRSDKFAGWEQQLTKEDQPKRKQ